MPIYTYICDECRHNFEIFMSITKYPPENSPACPVCDESSNVRRDIQADVAGITNIMPAQTLGSFAEKKTNKMSQDEKFNKWYDQNKYKFESPVDEPEMKLPKNAKRIIDPKIPISPADTKSLGLKKKRGTNVRRKKS